MREIEAKLFGWPDQTLIKVGNAEAFAAGKVPTERMVLDLRRDNEVLSRSLINLPWAGFLVSDLSQAPADRPYILVAGDADIESGDVLEFRSSRRRISIQYRRGDLGNVLFATERCNNFCLMCSQPPRDIDDGWREQAMRNLVDLVDPDEQSLGISGGEPTLLGDGLVRVVRYCADVLPRTHLHVLSNGRRFTDRAYAAAFESLHPALTWGIPLYGDTYRLHDYVVQAPGAFADTMRGLYALFDAGQRIEIRVVLVKPAVERLQALARYIHRNLPFVEHVALMGMEPIGFAKANRETLWIDPVDAVPAIVATVDELAGHGHAVSLYNLPLCVLPRPLWEYARRSISTWKQSYLPSCEGCAVRARCGGFFQWVTPGWTSRAIAPLNGDEIDA